MLRLCEFMMTGRTMPRSSLWATIATTLAEEIAHGRYAPGDRLPSEAQLAARFGVNRHTLRRAVADLSGRGIVQPRMGSGIFVAQGRRIDYPIGRRVRFHASLAAQGASGRRSILTAETRRADPREAEALRLPGGAPVHAVEGISYADGVPLSLYRAVFPADRFPGLPARLGEDASFTALLAAYGVQDYTRARTEISAAIADATQALRLRVAEGAPLLITEAVDVDLQGTPIEVGTSWFCAERVTLTIEPE
jgi:GntR family phosphonate transport system transcriptional regulator